MDRFRWLVGRPRDGVKGAISSKAGSHRACRSSGTFARPRRRRLRRADSSGGSSGEQLNLVAYSVVETVYDEALIPGFQKTSEGEGATFKNSFGPSGDQQRAVIAGQPADYVHLSIEPDMQALVDAGIVDSGWQDNQYNGIVQDSVVVFAVRKGNPENIQTWDDVVKPGVEVVTPNVFSSGGAKWNLMAAYGAQLNQGKSPEEALAFLKTVLEHAVVQPGSAGDALTAFTSGKGDVLLAYESDSIEAQNAGEEIDYVIPDDTLLIETPAATTVDAPDAGGGLPHLPVDARGAAAVGGRRLPAGGQVGARQERGHVPDPARPVRHRQPRRVGEGQRRVLRSRERQRRKDREDLGVSTG